MMMHRNIPFSLGFSQFPLPFHLELFLPLNKAKSESIEQKPPLEKKNHYLLLTNKILSHV